MPNQPTKNETLRQIFTSQWKFHENIAFLKQKLVDFNLLSDAILYAHADGCMTIIQKFKDTNLIDAVSLHHLTAEVVADLPTKLIARHADRAGLFKEIFDECRVVTYTDSWLSLIDSDVASRSDPWFMYKESLDKLGFSSNMTIIAKID